MKNWKVRFENSIMKAYEMPEEPDTVDGASDFEWEWDRYEKRIKAARATALPVATESIPGVYHLIKWQISLSDYKEGKHDDQPFFNPDFTKEYQIECDFQEKVIREHEIIHGTLGRETIWNDVKVLVLVEESKFEKAIRETVEQESKPKETQRSEPSAKARNECAIWLTQCINEFGFKKENLDALEKIWWEYHDFNGKLVSFPVKSVSAKKESQTKLLSELIFTVDKSGVEEAFKYFTITRKPQ